MANNTQYQNNNPPGLGGGSELKNELTRLAVNRDAGAKESTGLPSIDEGRPVRADQVCHSPGGDGGANLGGYFGGNATS